MLCGAASNRTKAHQPPRRPPLRTIKRKGPGQSSGPPTTPNPALAFRRKRQRRPSRPQHENVDSAEFCRRGLGHHAACRLWTLQARTLRSQGRLQIGFSAVQPNTIVRELDSNPVLELLMEDL